VLHPTVNTFAPEYATTTLDRRGNEREKTSTYVQRMKKPKNNATVRPPAHLCTAPDLLPTLILALIAPSQMRSKCAKAVCLCCLEHKLKDQLDHIERQKQDPLLLKTRTWELAVKDGAHRWDSAPSLGALGGDQGALHGSLLLLRAGPCCSVFTQA